MWRCCCISSLQITYLMGNEHDLAADANKLCQHFAFEERQLAASQRQLEILNVQLAALAQGISYN